MQTAQSSPAARDGAAVVDILTYAAEMSGELAALVRRTGQDVPADLLALAARVLRKAAESENAPGGILKRKKPRPAEAGRGQVLGGS